MKPMPASRYYTWYGNGIVSHNAYLNGVRIASIVKRSNDYRIELYNNTCVNVSKDTEVYVSNKNGFIVR